MIRTHSSGGVVLNKQGQVLVVTHNGSRAWTLPKGHMKPGETPQVTAVREIKEESGITQLTFIRDLGTYERLQMTIDGHDDPNEMKAMHFFLFTTDEIDLAPTDPTNPEAAWMKLDMVTVRLTHPKDKAFFQSILPQLQDFIA